MYSYQLPIIFCCLLFAANALVTNIVNLDNTASYPENTAGVIFEAFGDAASTGAWTVTPAAAPVGAVCNAVTDTTAGTCQATQASCKIQFDTTTADFETNPIEYCTLTVDAVTGTLQIDITDLDDETPETLCNETTVTVDENDESHQGTFISHCTSTSTLNFAIQFSMSVDPVWAAAKFEIDQATGVVTWASGALNNNFENQASYTLSVAAYTSGRTDPTPLDITVTVNNINEAPVITNLPQVVYVEEDFPRYSTSVIVDISLVLLNVSDDDNSDPGIDQAHTGIVTQSSCNGTTDYFQFIASSGNDVLQLDSDSTNAIFDYEPTLGTLCNEFILNIVVQDDNSVDGTALNSSNYTLTVIVLNKEEVPWFNEDGNLALGMAVETTIDYPERVTYPDSVFVFSESKAPGVFSGITSSPDSTLLPATDTDGVYIADLDDWTAARGYYDPDCSPYNNCTGVTFQILNSTGGLLESHFDISIDTGNKYHLFLVSSINYEVYCVQESFTSSIYPFNLTIVAVDPTGLQTTNAIGLYMTLTDDNEYDPVMDPTHEFSVAENAPFGTNVGTTIVCQSEIECYPDTITTFAILTTLPSANDGGYYFEFVTTNVGQLTVARPPDYELIQQVIFEVRCRDLNDGEGDRRSSTTTVTVNIVDQNDNEPQMVQTFFSVATRYDAEYRTFLARLQVTDADSGLNALPIFAPASPSDEFGVDSDTGDVFTKEFSLIPYHSYIFYAAVFDTGEPGQPRNIGNDVATIRVDTFDPAQVLVDLYLGIEWTSYDPTVFVAALNDLMAPYVFFIQQNTGGVTKENTVTNGVRVTVYAIENNSTMSEANLAEEKRFVAKETLLRDMREYADGTPSELFQSPEIVDFRVVYVEASPISTDFDVEEGDEERWMLDTPEGNLALVALCLFILIAVVLILIGLFLLLQKAECVGFDRSVREEVYDAPKMTDNKLLVGRLNKSSVTAMAREKKQVVASTTPAPKATATVAPEKNKLVPVVPAAPLPPAQLPPQITQPAAPPPDRDGGRKIWEIRRSRENGAASPLAGIN